MNTYDTTPDPRDEANYPVTPNQPEPQISTSRRRKWIYIVLIVFILALCSWFFWNRQSSQNVEKTVTLTSPKYKDLTVQVTLPQNWISEPFRPDNSGSAPIVLFASKKDKTEYEASLQTSDANADFPDYRLIIGLAVSPSYSDLTKHDRILQMSPGYVKLLVESKSFSNGAYRCAENKQDDNYEIQCFAYYPKSGKTALFNLNTTSDHLKSDLETYYKVIESTLFE